MRRLLALAPLTLLLASCAPVLNANLLRSSPQLAADPQAPELALLHFRTALYLEGQHDPLPTICVGIGQGTKSQALPKDRELRLIAAVPVVAPHERCRLEGKTYLDAITGGPAVNIDVHDLTCSKPDDCVAWGGFWQDEKHNGWSYYRLQYQRGAWQIREQDLGIVLTSR